EPPVAELEAVEPFEGVAGGCGRDEVGLRPDRGSLVEPEGLAAVASFPPGRVVGVLKNVEELVCDVGAKLRGAEAIAADQHEPALGEFWLPLRRGGSGNRAGRYALLRA